MTLNEVQDRILRAEPIGWFGETVVLFEVEFSNSDFKLGRHGNTFHVTINVESGGDEVEYYCDPRP